jgi:uncharacterized surface anchored protein
MKSTLISFLIIVTVAISAHAQTSNGAINGQVKDPEGANLPGATVSLYARDRTFSLVTVTNSSGAYSFKNLAPGEYLVEAELSGFALASAQAVTVTRGQTTTHDIALELSGLRASVVITASDTPQTVDELSKALKSVTNQLSRKRCASCPACACSSSVVQVHSLL